MDKLTLFELHLSGDTQFGPKSMTEAVEEAGAASESGLLSFASRRKQADTSETETDDTEVDVSDEFDTDASSDDDSEGSNKLLALVGFVALVLAVVVLRRVLGEEEVAEFEPEMVELDDVDEVAESDDD
ncbi:hypothetical protein [Haloarchaeobius sp. DFWS5]|uniref:hypothetical protein n=1 Tax=Haloarchaeobius sp. DFWS5 TaxID=3446114 RepID=UPI003EBDA035